MTSTCGPFVSGSWCSIAVADVVLQRVDLTFDEPRRADRPVDLQGAFASRVLIQCVVITSLSAQM